MEFKVFNYGRSCHADGIYSNGNVTVRKGSKLFIDCNNKFNRYAEAFAMRNNTEIVDSEGILLKDCTFKTPSAAAVFVAGSSRSGNTFWKVENGLSLGKYLEQKGIIERKRRSKNGASTK